MAGDSGDHDDQDDREHSTPDTAEDIASALVGLGAVLFAGWALSKGIKKGSRLRFQPHRAVSSTA